MGLSSTGDPFSGGDTDGEGGDRGGDNSGVNNGDSGGVAMSSFGRAAGRTRSISQRPVSTTTCTKDAACRSPSASSQGAIHSRRSRGFDRSELDAADLPDASGVAP